MKREWVGMEVKQNVAGAGIDSVNLDRGIGGYPFT